MMPADQLPAFIIIGAVKAATTWISHQLRHHPALWLPDAEPHYFSDRHDRGLGWYRSLFAEAPASAILGEKSADYLAHPLAAGRIASLLPGAPLIVQLRDPVERAYSDYCMLFRRGQVDGDPRAYLSREAAADARFLRGGLYATHLQRFLDHFPRTQLCTLLFEDVRDRPEETIARVCDHIGVETHVAAEQVGQRRNDSRAAMLPLPLRRMLRPARPFLDPLRSVPWLAELRGRIARPVVYPPLTPELRAEMRQFYREDIRRLEELIDRDLGDWLVDRVQREPAAA
jgi:hypothetical protein